jgi:hypothetical protein
MVRDRVQVAVKAVEGARVRAVVVPVQVRAAVASAPIVVRKSRMRQEFRAIPLVALNAGHRWLENSTHGGLDCQR